MAPHFLDPPKSPCTVKEDLPSKQTEQHEGKPYVYKMEIVWANVLIFIYAYLVGVYALYLMFTANCKFQSTIFFFAYGILAALGITAGAHRLWTHKAYKARLPLRLLLTYLQTAAFQNHTYEWVRDHRVHHKYCDTNADPHNSKRGFFFSHVGWLMVRKHRDVIEKGKTIDLSDLEKDPIVMFQKRNYAWLMPLCAFIIPSLIPWYFWGEDGWISYHVCGLGRWIFAVNGTWLVNSAAHMWGDKPFDKSMTAVECPAVGFCAIGEGWHNYHHAFPWDYKASELRRINLTTRFLNAMAKIGWAYDLKEASPELIKNRIERTGKELPKENPHEGEIWGWDDQDMSAEERKLVSIRLKGD